MSDTSIWRKTSKFIRDKPIFSSERMLHNDYDHKGSVEKKMALESTQPLTDMSTRNLSGGKGWPARKADNLTAICEPIV
jgi:hypothetical protein